MKKLRLSAAFRSLILCLIAFGFVAFARGEARADEVYLAGFTYGCFGDCVSGPSHTVGGLTFNGSTYSGTTANGFRGLGGNANPGTNFNNLGSLSLSTLPQTYNTTFELDVAINAPQGMISPGNYAAFFATLTGTVRSDDQGGVFIDFDNTPILFTFVDTVCEADPTGGVPGQQTTCGTGSFYFSVNDLAIDPGQIVSITGQITGAQQQTPVPEPMTVLLLGTGLSGVAAAARRRRKADK